MPYNRIASDAELLDFSQNFSVVRPNYMGSTLFPDQKTQYVDVEYSRLCKNGNLPQVAKVHSFDTEAHIASRIPFESMSHETLLIKEKINQTEEIRRITRNMRMDNIKQYVFDDAARLAENVVTRVELAKTEALSTGKMTVKENGLSFEVDYGVPSDNRVTSKWDADADILGDIRAWRKIAMDGGATPDMAVTTEAVVLKMMQNASIQKAIFGASGVGILPTLDQINQLLYAQAKITIATNEQRYGELKAGEDGKLKMDQHRMFPEDVFVMFATAPDGSIGAGLWGITPQEEHQGGAFDTMRQQQYVTVSQYEKPDPVALWTKAEGVFIPVIPNPWGHVIANVATPEG